jgi:hypothetical protein
LITDFENSELITLKGRFQCGLYFFQKRGKNYLTKKQVCATFQLTKGDRDNDKEKNQKGPSGLFGRQGDSGDRGLPRSRTRHFLRIEKII